jgi:phage tail-like protein
MASSARVFSGFRFQVWFTNGPGQESMINASFSEVGGLEANVEVKAYPEGGRSEGVRQLPGRVTYPNLVLKRGLSRDIESFRWFASVAAGVRPAPRKGVIIELLDTDFSSVVARWKVLRALPVKMKASDLSAKGGEVAIEELHLAHEGLTFDTSVGGG